MNGHLYRSRDDRILVGVAGGLAENFGVDPSLVRILWVILTPLTGGLALLLYIVMAFVVPQEPAGNARWAAGSRPAGGPGSSTAGATDPKTVGPTAAAGDAAAGDAAADAVVAPGRHRDGTGALIFGLLLVLIGSFFLARAYIPNLDVDRLWPIMAVVIGVLLLVGSVRRSRPPPVQ